MKSFLSIVLWLFCVSVSAQQISADTNYRRKVYNVYRAEGPVSPSDKWNMSEWRKVRAIKIANHMGVLPPFVPTTEVKMLYDDANIYLLFKVEDRFVQVLATEINGPVWRDSAVEFFFAPNPAAPADYFNLEINAGGTPLLGHKGGKPSVVDIQRIEIAHTLPKVVSPEITEPITWTIYARIPLDMISKYVHVAKPSPGVSWRANFYKIADKESNRHFLSWSEVKNDKPNFHLPEFFGILNFK
jgi:hypothetical protein